MAEDVLAGSQPFEGVCVPVLLAGFEEKVQVEVDLAGIFGFEAAGFELKNDQCVEAPVVEQKIDEVLSVIGYDAVLIGVGRDGEPARDSGQLSIRHGSRK